MTILGKESQVVLEYSEMRERSNKKINEMTINKRPAMRMYNKGSIVFSFAFSTRQGVAGLTRVQ